MKFGPVPIDEAEGAVLAHATTAGDKRFRKAHRLSSEDIAALNIPTGMPLVYRLDESLAPTVAGGEYLDPEAAAEAAAAVANQGR